MVLRSKHRIRGPGRTARVCHLERLLGPKTLTKASARKVHSSKRRDSRPVDRFPLGNSCLQGNRRPGPDPDRTSEAWWNVDGTSARLTGHLLPTLALHRPTVRLPSAPQRSHELQRPFQVGQANHGGVRANVRPDPEDQGGRCL